MYWDFRCLTCSGLVVDHAGFWARWRWRRAEKRRLLLRQVAEAEKNRNEWRERLRELRQR
jgi:hypothetical protein